MEKILLICLLVLGATAVITTVLSKHIFENLIVQEGFEKTSFTFGIGGWYTCKIKYKYTDWMRRLHSASITSGILTGIIAIILLFLK